jgi:probable rRNA maturation factor
LLDETGYGHLTADRTTDLFVAAFRERDLDLDRVGEVSVVLVGPETIRKLNSEFRSKDAETDVLSFEVDGPYGEMVGEVVICPACADMPVEELVVHGALHLAGMDHGEDFGSSEMAETQRGIMEQTGG